MKKVTTLKSGKRRKSDTKDFFNNFFPLFFHKKTKHIRYYINEDTAVYHVNGLIS